MCSHLGEKEWNFPEVETWSSVLDWSEENIHNKWCPQESPLQSTAFEWVSSTLQVLALLWKTVMGKQQ